MKLVSIKQGGIFPGSSHDIYELWLDETKHAQLTGSQAKISRKVGGSFTTFDGWATGTNIELVRDKKIVQTWRGEDWPDKHYSTLTIKLIPIKGGKTKLLFRQTAVPAEVAKDVSSGWREFYWEPMKRMLAMK
jgi:activator of HSP90 ATPase